MTLHYFLITKNY
jgi:hypothetical protein